MCLFANLKWTEDFVNQHKENDIITVWKWVITDKDGKIYSPFRQTLIPSGTYKSDRNDNSDNSDSDNYNEYFALQFYPNQFYGEIRKGIHVFLTYDDALKYISYHKNDPSQSRIIEAKAKLKDLVAVGASLWRTDYYGQIDYFKGAVFTEIEVPEILQALPVSKEESL